MLDRSTYQKFIFMELKKIQSLLSVTTNSLNGETMLSLCQQICQSVNIGSLQAIELEFPSSKCILLKHFQYMHLTLFVFLMRRQFILRRKVEQYCSEYLELLCCLTIAFFSDHFNNFYQHDFILFSPLSDRV